MRRLEVGVRNGECGRVDGAVVVAGVDVGSTRKGFHCVALRNGVYFEQFASGDASAMARWCLRVGARVVGVDAPCRWSLDGRARAAERELMGEKIWCFSTPTREAAAAHVRGHFGWMLNGEMLFETLRPTHVLFDGVSTAGNLCFETFPQAVACALAGAVVSAKRKGTVRRELLRQFGVDCSALSNIDKVDAGLCAVAAHFVAMGRFKKYGEVETGFIVVPDARAR
ncbi:MAG: DUF429 domain-containing protein [Phycisphaerales bacterium]